MYAIFLMLQKGRCVLENMLILDIAILKSGNKWTANHVRRYQQNKDLHFSHISRYSESTINVK